MGKTRRKKIKTNSQGITDALIKNTTVKNKVVRITDAVPGLFIALFPTGVKTWYIRKSCDEGRLQLRIGRYSDGYTIAQAREAARQINNYAELGEAITVPTMLSNEDLRRLNPKGLPPACTFRELYEEWHREIGAKKLDVTYLERINGQMNTHVLPQIGDIDVTEITAKMVHDMAKAVENSGRTETAHRVISLCGRVFRYGVITQRATGDPTLLLKESIAPAKKGHMPSIPASNTLRIGELIYKARCRNEECYKMMLLQAYTFVRPSELRFMQWSELDLDNRIWRIPADRMKMSSPHIVPLSRQAIKILRSIKRHENNIYVFTLAKSPESRKPANANAVLNAIKTLGFNTGEMSAHGFRSIASTILNESGKFSGDAIERQLSHVPGNRVRAAYNYAQHINDRTEMIQWYADKLDSFESEYAKKQAAANGIRVCDSVEVKETFKTEPSQSINSSLMFYAGQLISKSFLRVSSYLYPNK
ncbi:MAG: tyrosine-type recombinase/integrase [Synergistaceae bacterium]